MGPGIHTWGDKSEHGAPRCARFRVLLEVEERESQRKRTSSCRHPAGAASCGADAAAHRDPACCRCVPCVRAMMAPRLAGRRPAAHASAKLHHAKLQPAGERERFQCPGDGEMESRWLEINADTDACSVHGIRRCCARRVQAAISVMHSKPEMNRWRLSMCNRRCAAGKWCPARRFNGAMPIAVPGSAWACNASAPDIAALMVVCRAFSTQPSLPSAAIFSACGLSPRGSSASATWHRCANTGDR